MSTLDREPGGRWSTPAREQRGQRGWQSAACLCARGADSPARSTRGPGRASRAEVRGARGPRDAGSVSAMEGDRGEGGGASAACPAVKVGGAREGPPGPVRCEAGPSRGTCFQGAGHLRPALPAIQETARGGPKTLPDGAQAAVCLAQQASRRCVQSDSHTRHLSIPDTINIPDRQDS